MVKKLRTTLCVFLAALLIAGCASNGAGGGNTPPAGAQTGNGDSAGEGTPGEPAPSGGTDTPAESTTGYDAVLEEYRDMVRNDFYEAFRDTDDFDSKFGADIGYELRNQKQDLFYALYDFDGNGTEELIIGGGLNAGTDPVFAPWNYDLYAFDGSQAVHVFPDMDFGYRTNFFLYGDGIIGVEYSSSAAESGTDFYRIDGTGAELVDAFTAVGRLENDESVFSYFQNGEEITEEAYHAGISGYQSLPADTLSWIPIQ